MNTDNLIERIAEEIYQKLKNEPSSSDVPSFGSDKNVARMIDHTLLKQDATEAEIVQLCKEAKEYNFASVCVNPSYVPLCRKELISTPVKVCTVIGFPLGATTTKTKVFEAVEASENGAEEVDMVVNVGKIKSGDWNYVKTDIESVVVAMKDKSLVKVILETCLLTKDEIEKTSEICRNVGAGFVKTSTGFSTGGATEEDVRLMRNTVGQNVGVKASGGIRDAQTAQNMIEAGANRLGTSSGIAIVEGKTGSSSY